MKKLHTYVFIIIVSFMTSSCFLFRPTHERCPAYGINQKENKSIDLKIEVILDKQV